MTRGMLLAILTLVCEALAWSQGLRIVSGASFREGVAPDSFATVFGSDLAATTATGSLNATGRYPLELAGVRATIGGVPAQLAFVSPSQINLIVPPEIAAAPAAALEIVTPSGPRRASVAVLSAAPALFFSASTRADRGAILNAVNNQPDPFFVETPEISGSDRRTRLAIYATGIRRATAVEVLATTQQTSLPLSVEYAGPAPGFPGLDQVNAVLPAALDGAGWVEITVVANRVRSNPVSVYIGRLGESVSFAGPAYRTRVAAGNGQFGRGGDVQPLTSATMQLPTSLAIDSRGGLLFIDYRNARVRRFVPGDVVESIAGSGVDGDAGDGGPARDARLHPFQGLAADANGNVFIADTFNHRIRRILPDGTITTIAGDGVSGFAGDNGPPAQARLSFPTGLAVDRNGDLYIADRGNQRIRRIGCAAGQPRPCTAQSIVIDTIAGTGGVGFAGDGGPATEALLNFPEDVAVDGAGNLYIADSSNFRVRRVTPDGYILSVAGNGQRGSDGDGGLALAAQLGAPFRIAVDRSGALYISDTATHRIRRVGHDGVIRTIAGTGEKGSAEDGLAALDGPLNAPHGLAFAADGTIYVADTNNRRIRALVPSGDAPPVRPGSPALSAVDLSEWIAMPRLHASSLRPGDAIRADVELKFLSSRMIRPEPRREIAGETLVARALTGAGGAPPLRFPAAGVVYPGGPDEGRRLELGPAVLVASPGSEARAEWTIERTPPGGAPLPDPAAPVLWGYMNRRIPVELRTAAAARPLLAGIHVSQPAPLINEVRADATLKLDRTQPAETRYRAECHSRFLLAPCAFSQTLPVPGNRRQFSTRLTLPAAVPPSADLVASQEGAPAFELSTPIETAGLGRAGVEVTRLAVLRGDQTTAQFEMDIRNTAQGILRQEVQISGTGFAAAAAAPAVGSVILPFSPPPCTDNPCTTRVFVNAPGPAIYDVQSEFEIPAGVLDLTIDPPFLQPDRNLGTATVRLDAPSPGQILTTRTDTAFLRVPGQVDVRRHERSVTFPVQVVAPIESILDVPVEASGGARSARGTVTLLPGGTPALSLSTLAARPDQVVSGNETQLEITLSQPAPAIGYPVLLRSSSPVIVLPVRITIPPGERTAFLPLRAGSVNAPAAVTVTATTPFGTRATTITVSPPLRRLLDVKISPAELLGGQSGTGTVTLDGPATAGGIAITLSSPGGLVVPDSVVIPSGSTSVEFPLGVQPVLAPTTVTLNASYAGVTRSATAIVIPASYLTAISIDPVVFPAGTIASGTVQLSGPAPEGGARVDLGSTNSAVTVPPFVIVLPGQNSIRFQLLSTAVPAPANVQIRATYGSITLVAPITVTP